MEFFSNLDFYSVGESIKKAENKKGDSIDLEPMITLLNGIDFLSSKQCRAFIHGLGFNNLESHFYKYYRKGYIKIIEYFLLEKCKFSKEEIIKFTQPV